MTERNIIPLRQVHNLVFGTAEYIADQFPDLRKYVRDIPGKVSQAAVNDTVGSHKGT